MTVGVLYTCKDCGLIKERCEVPARTTGNVVDWVKHVSYLVKHDHTRKSPHCKALVVDLMIPMTGTDKVGGSPVN